MWTVCCSLQNFKWSKTSSNSRDQIGESGELLNYHIVTLSEVLFPLKKKMDFSGYQNLLVPQIIEGFYFSFHCFFSLSRLFHL
jgi:hypothetical protein